MSSNKAIANNTSPSQGGSSTKGKHAQTAQLHTKQEQASLAQKSKERGFWCASFTQRGSDQLKEQELKAKLPTGAFDPNKIDEMMEPKQTMEQLLMEKYEKGDTVTKKEKIIIDNIISKEKDRIMNDLAKIEKQGLNARPETDEGRIRLLYRFARFYLDNDNDKLVYYTWTKLNDIVHSPKLLKEFGELRAEMKETIDTLDTIKLQCNDYHHNMPPLNEKGFVRLDDWQKQVIHNIRNEVSTVVKAPTSAGKTIIMSYLFAHNIANITAVYIVPTDNS
jgi:superfamily II RNA helicase